LFLTLQFIADELNFNFQIGAYLNVLLTCENPELLYFTSGVAYLPDINRVTQWFPNFFGPPPPCLHKLIPRALPYPVKSILQNSDLLNPLRKTITR
jgi:hypothetical protein